MTLTKNQILAIIFAVILLISLPVAIFLTQKRQDIRPKAVDILPTPTLVGSYSPCTDNSQCADTASCVNNQCLPLRCPLMASQCLTYVRANHTCQPSYSPNGTFCNVGGGGAAGYGSCQNGTCVATSISTIPLSSACLTLPTYDTFSGATLNTSLWNWRIISGGTATQSAGVLTASLAGGTAGYSGVITTNTVCGDFDATVDFSQFTSSSQITEADVRLAAISSDNSAYVFIQKFSKTNEQGFWTDSIVNNNPQGGNVYDSPTTTGKLRIRRIGSVFSTFYNIGNGWVNLGTFNGFTTNANIILEVDSSGQNPSVSANFDNFNLTNAIPDVTPTCSPKPACVDAVPRCLLPVPPGGWCSAPPASPTPTPASGRDRYIIDVGDKQSLVINIGAAIAPQIRFKAKLGSLRKFPDLYLRLRVKDELAFLGSQGNAAPSADTCNNPTPPDKDFYIPVKATGDVYSPVQQISGASPAGAQLASVTPDGWVILDGMVPGRYYSLYLKGPKTRKSREAQHFLLQPNQTSSQDFDWTANPLDPGDLPDPNNGGKQHCTVNSLDWSLLQARIGVTDQPSLDVCDVNYDGICNAGDSVAILDTLSKRPDDDQ